MELKEVMRLIWQGLINLPSDVPEREETIRAYGALTSNFGYMPPEYLLVPRADGYTDVKFATEVGGLERPVPQTYGDWVNLAESIKTATPDLDTQYTTNLHLQEIAIEGPNQDAAKRWLVEKAGELGIR